MKSHLEPPNPTFQSRADEYNFNNLRYIHKNEYYPQGLNIVSRNAGRWLSKIKSLFGFFWTILYTKLFNFELVF